MKRFRNFSFFIFHFSFLLACLCANATPSYWVAAYANKYSADGDAGSEASKSAYSGYYCTVETATTLFEGATASKINSLLSNSYNEYTDAKGYGASDGVTWFDSVTYSDGQYQFLDYLESGVSSTDYIALLFYASGGSEGFQVLTSAALTPNAQLQLTAGTDSSWQAAPEMQNIPEPTSGVLLLLGLAGLALKRRR